MPVTTNVVPSNVKFAFVINSLLSPEKKILSAVAVLTITLPVPFGVKLILSLLARVLITVPSIRMLSILN